MIEMQCFDRVVRANSMARCFCAEPRALRRFVGEITAMAISSFDERVVLGLRNDVIEVGHGMKEERTLGGTHHLGHHGNDDGRGGPPLTAVGYLGISLSDGCLP